MKCFNFLNFRYFVIKRKETANMEKYSAFRVFIVYFTPMYVLYCLYLLSYYPAIMSYDSIDQWKQADSFVLNDWHPVFHTLFVYIIKQLNNTPAAVAFIQIITLSAAISLLLMQLEKSGVKRRTGFILSFIYALNPVNGIFSISMWKDIPYSISLIFLSYVLLKIYSSEGNWILKNYNKLTLGIILLCTSLFRHNGLVPVLVSSLLLIIVYKAHYKRFLIIFTLTGLLFIFIKIPLYNILNVSKTSDMQPYVLSMLQISAIAHNNGKVDDKEKEFLSKMAEWEDLKKGYNRYNILGITSSDSFNKDFFKQNKAKYIKTWIKLVLKNPGISVKAYLDRINLIWRIDNPTGVNNLVSNSVIYTNDMGLKTESRLPFLKNILDAIADATKKPYLNWLFWRPAIYLYITLIICILILFSGINRKSLLVLIPSLANVAGLILVTVSSQTRYYYASLLVLPFAVVYYYNMYRQDKHI